MNNNFEEARFKAIKYIGISKKTTYEVKKKLLLFGYDNDVVEDVIKYLNNLEYLNDFDYVKSFILQNKRMEKYSIFEIINKLKNKGIDVKLYSNLIDELDSEYENNVINKLENSKLKNFDDIHRKSYLYRRGFKNNFFD